VDTRGFLALEATSDAARWRLPVSSGICTPGGFLYGGSGLAAAIEALEGTTGRPAVWATAQYLSFARPPSTLEIEVTVAAGGHQVTQARAVGRVDGREILTVNAALGTRSFEIAGEWAIRPDVPPPDECPSRDHRRETANSVMGRMETRLAIGRELDLLDGTSGGGTSALWCHLPGLLEMSAGTLALLGDFVPFGISQATGMRAGGTSLDNTLRVVQLVPTDWVLADVRVHGVHHGFGHGVVHLWAQDGPLLGTASQSAIVRLWRD
jgi:acyl-CoA thioesterase-2